MVKSQYSKDKFLEDYKKNGWFRRRFKIGRQKDRIEYAKHTIGYYALNLDQKLKKYKKKNLKKESESFRKQKRRELGKYLIKRYKGVGKKRLPRYQSLGIVGDFEDETGPASKYSSFDRIYGLHKMSKNEISYTDSGIGDGNQFETRRYFKVSGGRLKRKGLDSTTAEIRMENERETKFPFKEDLGYFSKGEEFGDE